MKKFHEIYLMKRSGYEKEGLADYVLTSWLASFKSWIGSYSSHVAVVKAKYRPSKLQSEWVTHTRVLNCMLYIWKEISFPSL